MLINNALSVGYGPFKPECLPTQAPSSLQVFQRLGFRIPKFQLLKSKLGQSQWIDMTGVTVHH